MLNFGNKGGIIARCPFCNEILDDAWVKSQGASLMGKEGGKVKKRANAREASQIRWAKDRAAKKKRIEDLNSPIDK
jgi:hypothetical protein